MTQQSRTGGQILVDALQIHGVDTAFGVPGESYLDVLDALHDSGIRFIINRQEGGAAFRSLRQADGQAGHLLRHARTGRHQRLDRRAHGVPGFDADDPVHRPGGQ